MEDNKTEKIFAKDKLLPDTEISENAIKNLIYTIRGQQVILDSDLAMLYQIETKNLNKAVKRNINRFPEDFCFQLIEEEYVALRLQSGTSNDSETTGRGGRRYMPYAFTEQGISMLSAVLHSETAVKVSIGIIRAFVEMRRFLANNALIFERVNEIEVRQLAFQKSTEEKFNEVFHYISEHEESAQKIFFNGQIYDAFSLLVDLVARAEKMLVLVDNYVDINTLNILAKKKEDVEVIVYTELGTRLSVKDVNNFNQQYPTLNVKYTGIFHDRFLVIDDTYAYHIGASMKDAGKKCFGISLINDIRIVHDILERLRLESEEQIERLRAKMSVDKDADRERAKNALAEILSMEKRLLDDFDPEKELEEAWAEKYGMGYGDYTKEKQEQPDMSLEEIDLLLKNADKE